MPKGEIVGRFEYIVVIDVKGVVVIDVKGVHE